MNDEVAATPTGKRVRRSIAEQVADGSIQAGPPLDREGVAEHVADTAKRRAAAGPQVYVVQRLLTPPSETGGDYAEPTWRDIATVTVPPRSKRRTVIERALNAANPTVVLPVTLRILDADAAREFPVGLKPRDPELVIG